MKRSPCLCWQMDYLDSLVGASPWALFPNYFGGSEMVVAGQMQAGKWELGIQLTAHDPKSQLLMACHSEMATNSSKKNFGCSGELAYNVATSPAISGPTSSLESCWRQLLSP